MDKSKEVVVIYSIVFIFISLLFLASAAYNLYCYLIDFNYSDFVRVYYLLIGMFDLGMAVTIFSMGILGITRVPNDRVLNNADSNLEPKRKPKKVISCPIFYRYFYIIGILNFASLIFQYFLMMAYNDITGYLYIVYFVLVILGIFIAFIDELTKILFYRRKKRAIPERRLDLGNLVTDTYILIISAVMALNYFSLVGYILLALLAGIRLINLILSSKI